MKARKGANAGAWPNHDNILICCWSLKLDIFVNVKSKCYRLVSWQDNREHKPWSTSLFTIKQFCTTVRRLHFHGLQVMIAMVIQRGIIGSRISTLLPHVLRLYRVDFHEVFNKSIRMEGISCWTIVAYLLTTALVNRYVLISFEASHATKILHYDNWIFYFG